MISPESNIHCYAVREVTIRYKTMKKYPQGRRFSNSREIYQLFRSRMISERVESFESILLNSKNEVMAIDVVSRGSLSTSIVHPREVYSNAVRLQAAAIIFMHNHPSGDCAPSREDRDWTERLIKAGTLLGIRVLDHIVFGLDDYYSFADAGNLMQASGVPELNEILLPSEVVQNA